MENKKSCILLGGGRSLLEGVEKDIFNKIRDKDIWSLNFAYKTFAFSPSRQLWVDISFFNTNIVPLTDMARKGVGMYTRQHMKYSFIKEIHQYQVTRKANEYDGTEALKTGRIFIGRDGMVGMFALSLAIAEGYKEIFLCGYDYGTPSPNDSKTHYYQDKLMVISSGVGRPEIYWRDDGKIKDTIVDYEVYTRHNDIKIWNVSLRSNITYFERISYDNFFKMLKKEEENV